MSDTEIRAMIKRRGICKSKLTIFHKFLDSILDIVNSGLTIQNIKLTELQTRLTNVEEILKEFETIQSFLELNAENLEDQIKEREGFMNTYFELVATAKNIIQGPPKQEDNLIQNNTSIEQNSQYGNIDVRSKLGPLSIKKFSGQFEKWLEFRDTFISLVHTNKSLSDVDKFHHLRDALEGEAMQVIENINTSNANYTIAWDLLCERFNNESKLVDNHLRILFELPVMPNESASGIKKLFDGMIMTLRSLESLNVDVSGWDLIVIHIISSKLDFSSSREWQIKKSKFNNYATLEQFKAFLKEKICLLDTIDFKKNVQATTSTHKSKVVKTFVNVSTKCYLCQEEHSIYNCNDFLKLSTQSKFEKAKNLRLCLNCLRANHLSKDCKSGSCRKCKGRHHTLLHYDTPQNTANANASNESRNSHGSTIQNARVNTSSVVVNSDILLSTALVQVVNSSGGTQIARVLLDSGSQINLITEQLCHDLGLEKHDTHISMVGINQVSSDIRHKCQVTYQSMHNSFQQTVSCLVVSHITQVTSNRSVDTSLWNIPKHLRLADPGFMHDGSVDILLGVDVFYHLLSIGQFSLGSSLPIMQKTRLGWLVSGLFGPTLLPKNKVQCNYAQLAELNTQIEKFWSVEEPPRLSKAFMSEDDIHCEEIFQKTVTRDQNGHFIVQIPFSQSVEKLGNSELSSKRQFFAMERRLERNPKLRQMYIDFMVEYESMGHMSLVDQSEQVGCTYYLPHHGVLNQNSSTTALRVVFNGSAPTDNGVSLNDLQYVGPKVQDDLLSILLRFRLHNIVVCADIAKMYRMVFVRNDQRSLQRIYWRTNPQEDLRIYNLNTVTYGTTSAPYLAIRCLRQLGLDHQYSNPKASNVILHDFYVDDMLTGADTASEAATLGQQVSDILKSAGMVLRKWVSNSKHVIQSIAGESRINQNCHIMFGEKEENKTLGLFWSYQADMLKYHISEFSMSGKITKRSILSDSSKIYDPLGLLCPCVILSKIIIQKLWLEKLEWDASLPSHIHTLWLKLRSQFEYLNAISIPRQVICQNATIIEIHGFSDSSIEAYGGCVYLRSKTSSGEITSRLMCAKAKVAPLKVLTLPRLELCGALVLAQLVHNLLQSIKIPIHKIFLWTDSTVVLGWLSTSPHLLQTFVGNRVAQIQSLTSSTDWHHISGNDNPADLLSRGVYPHQMISLNKWWNGPEWLCKPSSQWPKSITAQTSDLPEMKKHCHVYVKPHLVVEVINFSRFSNFSRLTRCLAYCQRFIYNCQNSKEKRNYGPLCPIEIQTGLTLLIKLSQQESFPDEYRKLKENKPITKGSLSGLNPFLDSQGIIRVGGRLELSNLDYEKKHPSVIHGKHYVVKLLFIYEHKKLLHAGAQHLISSVREHYWPIRGRSLARSVIHNCVICFKTKPRQSEQLMGLLPKERVKSAPPFYTTGVDYAGPLYIKSKPGRGSTLIKSYICLFVCFTTRAIHLELVTQLTSEAFILALKRFIARRGKPNCLISDNGTNFVGAHADIKQVKDFLKNNSPTFVDYSATEGINWKFIPARSPHFGGIWEAGVKTCKYHLKRILGNSHLTFENMYTLLTQIEAIVNSRPLVPMSSDPNDPEVLTPAHFLVGRRLTSLPDADVQHIPENRLSKYQHLQKLYQNFWSRWSNEYLLELQKRNKWKVQKKNIQVGQIVIVREDNLPPLQWKIARVSELHPGPDKLCRVVTLRVGNSYIKRAVAKLCPLPNQD